MKQRRNKLNRVDDEVLKMLTGAGLKGDDLTKHLIMHKCFMNQVKPHIKRLSEKEITSICYEVQLMFIQFETVCIRAFKSLSGSQSTAKDIISMYSAAGVFNATQPKDETKLLK